MTKINAACKFQAATMAINNREIQRRIYSFAQCFSHSRTDRLISTVKSPLNFRR